MPTKRDATVYKSHHKALLGVMKDYDGLTLLARIGMTLRAWDRSLLEYEAAKMDAATDILRERGLCASVLDWHKKPAGDELEW